MRVPWRRSIRSPVADERLDAELRDHVERDVASRVARGLSEAEARRRSRLELGGLEQARDACRDVRPRQWLEESLRDVRLGWRALRREPLFTLSVTLILALGSGASVAMFSVLHAVVLRPLPYARPTELVWVTTQLIAQDRPDGTSMANLLDWRAQSRAFADLTSYRRPVVSLVTFAGADAPQRAQEGLVGPEFFTTLATSPLVGRTFTRDEFDRRERVVILSEGLWLEQFGGDATAVGRTLRIDGEHHVILGVMPRTFQLPTSETRFWRPLSVLSLWPATLTVRDSDNFEVLGRLAPGVSLTQARADMRAVAARLRAAHAVNRNVDVRIETLADHVIGSRTRGGVWLAFAAVLCLLTIACANVGGLLLARAARRRRELAVRVALGAGRTRLVRQLLAEAVSLWAVASVAGVLLAWTLIRLLLAYGPRTIPRIAEVGLDPWALVVAFGGSAVIVVACCALPARLATRMDATAAFATRESTNATSARGRDLLVGAQIGGAVVLLVGAVLFARSFLLASHEDPGYPAERLVVARLDLPRERYSDAAATAAFFRAAATRIGALPGVDAVGGITDFFIRRNADQWVTVRARPAGREAGAPRLAIEGVTPGFFRAAGIDLLEGRDFEEADYARDTAGVCIVSESLARRFWPDGRAIGQQLVSGDTPPRDGRWRTVVGVVRDIRRESRDVAPILGAYVPAFPRSSDLIVRVSTDVDALIPAIRQQLRSLDASLPVTRISSANGRLSERLDGRRFESQALAAFSVAALLLSATGLYSTLAYQVVLRRREIGIRAALGADRPALVRMVLAQALRIALGGTLVGLVTAASVATAMRSLLYQTAPVGAFDYGAAAIFTLAVVVMAAALPAWRASRVDPTTALRAE